MVGAHPTGKPLNHELTGPHGIKLAEMTTSPGYRLYALPETVPPKPGLIHDPAFAGPGIAVEVCALPAAAFGAFVARIPVPLSIGKLALGDGTSVSGFLCESHAMQTADDITAYGGWRAYRAVTS